MSDLPRIGIDCRLGGLEHAGIGRYIAELVSRLIEDETVTWVLFVYSAAQAQELIPNPPKNVQIEIAPIRHYSLREQLLLPRIFMRARLDLLHVPHFNVPLMYRQAFVVTVHDLLWHSHRGTGVTTLPKFLYWLKYVGYRVVASSAIKRAERILVPSQSVAHTLANYYPREKSKTVVTPEGIGTKLAAIAKRHRPSRRDSHILLYVGSLYPHKNVSVILYALKFLPKYTLKIVSARSVFQDALKKEAEALGVDSRVQFLGELSDTELAAQYSQAGALIQPSKSEGFGLTGLEAMAFSTPVVASDIPIFHEIYKSAALYFDPLQPDSLIKTLDKLEGADLQKMADQARTVAEQYSWDKAVALTRKLYQESLHE